MKNEYASTKISLATLFAVIIAFVGIVLTRFLREFTQAGLEGRKFAQYYSLFVPGLWVILLAVLLTTKNKPGTHRMWFWALAGALAGYASGLISITFIELFRPDGWDQLILQLHRSSNWVVRVGYPLVSLNWLVGLCAGMVGNAVNRHI